ncbi:unnamed protein product [Spirodela intermedia]|uniref:Uncharacterized protein n=1 Tax=Spirodela intermedia TaxID=51605 RepID=A0ABN7ED49_SPIIN|nr:unnamed protein product [Spirodela intermedia]
MGQEASASNSVMTAIVGGQDKIMYALPGMPERLKFNVTNLYQWEKFVELTLFGRGLSEHLIDDPEEESQLHLFSDPSRPNQIAFFTKKIEKKSSQEPNTVRILIALAAKLNWEIHQLMSKMYFYMEN